MENQSKNPFIKKPFHNATASGGWLRFGVCGACPAWGQGAALRAYFFFFRLFLIWESFGRKPNLSDNLKS